MALLYLGSLFETLDYMLPPERDEAMLDALGTAGVGAGRIRLMREGKQRINGLGRSAATRPSTLILLRDRRNLRGSSCLTNWKTM